MEFDEDADDDRSALELFSSFKTTSTTVTTS